MQYITIITIFEYYSTTILQLFDLKYTYDQRQWQDISLVSTLSKEKQMVWKSIVMIYYS